MFRTWLTLFILGCTGSYDGPPPTGDGAVYGRVISLLGAGLGGVEICVHDLDLPCVFSDGTGDFLLEGLPENTDVVVTMWKDGHLHTAYHHNTALDQEWRKTLMSNGIVNTMTNRVDTEQRPGMGHAMFILWNGPDYDTFERVEGWSVSVEPTGGEHFYQAGGGLPDPELTATSSSGSGGIFNLEPGQYSLTFSGAEGTCIPWFSHAFEPGEAVPMTVYPDMGSYIDLVCR